MLRGGRTARRRDAGVTSGDDGAVALQATIYKLEIVLSDVDRGVYETLELRVAQHPSENMRWLVLRVLAYCLSYEEGIAFSKGGISSTDEAPLAVHDPTGLLVAWIEIGSPSPERLHKASKAARRVALYTAADLAQLRRQAAAKAIHAVEGIDVWRIDPAFLDALAPKIERTTKLDITRNDGQLYVSIGGATMETGVTRSSLVE
jgi:uncharacterized protein YaeQ